MDLSARLQLPSHYVEKQILAVLQHEPGPTAVAGLPGKFIIACTARSGSSAVSVALERYGLDVREYLNLAGYVAEAKGRYGIRTTRALADHLARAHAPEGRLGLKVAYPNVPFLFLFDEFPDRTADWKVVFLTRQDRLRQAISARIASLSGQWTHAMPARRAVTEDDYDFAAILGLVETFSSENAQWERLFALLAIEPLRVTYEAFVADTDAVTERIATFVGVDPARHPDARSHPLLLRVQSTRLNDSWEQRFLADAARWTKG